MGKPSAIAAVLDSDDGGGPVPPVQAKRGSNTTLSQKLNPVELQKLVDTDEVPDGVHISEIDPNLVDFSKDINHRHQHWLSDENKSFCKLVESIKQEGQKIPILVRPKGDRFELIYGSRRRQACINIGSQVRAIVAEGISEQQAHELAIFENTNHQGLSPLEEAQALEAYKNRHPDLSHEKLGVIFSKSRQWVTYQLSFANLDDAIVDQCSDPWGITERATRSFRTIWASDAGQRKKWSTQLKRMGDTKLPYKKLLKQLMGESDDSTKELITNKEGRVVAELSGARLIGGRLRRQFVVYDDIDDTSFQSLIENMRSHLQLEA